LDNQTNKTLGVFFNNLKIKEIVDFNRLKIQIKIKNNFNRILKTLMTINLAFLEILYQNKVSLKLNKITNKNFHNKNLNINNQYPPISNHKIFLASNL